MTSLVDSIKNSIGYVLGYGFCYNCYRSWWYVEIGDGVAVDRTGRAIPYRSANYALGGGRFCLCEDCESTMHWTEILQFDANLVDIREWELRQLRPNKK